MNSKSNRTSPSTPQRTGLAAWIASGLLAAVAQGAFAQSTSAEAPLRQATVESSTTDRIVIKYRSGSAAASATSLSADSALANAASVATQAGVTMSVLRRTAQGAHVMKLNRQLSLTSAQQLAANLASADSNVEYAEPDTRMVALATANDPSYSQQWHYQESTAGINLPTAWDLATGKGVVVAVLDTGYRPHTDLAAHLLPGYDFVSTAAVGNDGGGRDADASDPGDAVKANECGYTHAAENASWHGTHVAGTISAVTNNGVGVAGVAPGAKVLPVRVLGKCGGYMSDIADGMIWAAGGSVSGVPANPNPARVINLSLGGTGSCGNTSQRAITKARALGTVVVVAAGNSATNASTSTPANCSGVVTVAAVNRSGGRAWYSNYGSVVDVAAPGGDTSGGQSNGVLSTLNAGTSSPGSDSYAWYQGTSMATPHVAGVAALMLSVNSGLTPDQVESLLRSSARVFPASCTGCGSGIVDARAAVVAAGKPASVAEVEPNEARASAQTVSAMPATLTGSISTSADKDTFRISVPAGATLSATLPGSTTTNLTLVLQDASGATLASSSAALGSTDALSLTNSTSAAVTWYVQVRYKSGTVSSRYTLSLAF